MSLRDEFEGAWRAGAGHDSLLAMVHRYQTQGLTAQEAYQVLQRLWLDSGFADIEQSDGLQDNLEYVLEKIWYECPAAER